MEGTLVKRRQGSPTQEAGSGFPAGSPGFQRLANVTVCQCGVRGNVMASFHAIRRLQCVKDQHVYLHRIGCQVCQSVFPITFSSDTGVVKGSQLDHSVDKGSIYALGRHRRSYACLPEHPWSEDTADIRGCCRPLRPLDQAPACAARS